MPTGSSTSGRAPGTTAVAWSSRGPRRTWSPPDRRSRESIWRRTSPAERGSRALFPGVGPSPITDIMSTHVRTAPAQPRPPAGGPAPSGCSEDEVLQLPQGVDPVAGPGEVLGLREVVV